MSRPPLPLGAHGKINRRQLDDGRWEASCRVRDWDGKTRKVAVVRGTGRKDDSGKAAEDALLERLATRPGAQTDELDNNATVSELYRAWKVQHRKANGKPVTPQTWRVYEQTFTRHVEPALGSLRLYEVRPSRLERFLSTLSARTPSAARFARVILSSMFSYAARLDVIESSPMRDVSAMTTEKEPTKALTVEEVAALRSTIRAWQETPVRGRARGEDLLDIVDVMLGTGCRIGEVLALRWEDVDLESTPPTATVTGTLVTLPGEGVVRQDHPKTATSRRTIVLPRFTVAALLHRQVEGWPNPHDVVFPSETGTLKNPNNVRRQLRDARKGTDLEWVTPHTFRRTVATLVKRERDLEVASDVLGHSDTRVTREAYIDGAQLVADVAEVLEVFGTENESGE